MVVLLAVKLSRAVYRTNGVLATQPLGEGGDDSDDIRFSL
jgi:hypothetical protein